MEIQIMGAPRSGSTLLKNLFTCFEDVVLTEDEKIGTVDKTEKGRAALVQGKHVVYKCPTAHQEYHFQDLVDQDFKIVYTIRDPRDMIMSGAIGMENIDEVHVSDWIDNIPQEEHPNIYLLRYGDLVARPDGVQAEIAEQFGLTVSGSFSKAHESEYFEVLLDKNQKIISTNIDVGDLQIMRRPGDGLAPRPISDESIGIHKVWSDEEWKKILDGRPKFRKILREYYGQVC